MVLLYFYLYVPFFNYVVLSVDQCNMGRVQSVFLLCCMCACIWIVSASVVEMSVGVSSLRPISMSKSYLIISSSYLIIIVSLFGRYWIISGCHWIISDFIKFNPIRFQLSISYWKGSWLDHIVSDPISNVQFISYHIISYVHCTASYDMSSFILLYHAVSSKYFVSHIVECHVAMCCITSYHIGIWVVAH